MHFLQVSSYKANPTKSKAQGIWDYTTFGSPMPTRTWNDPNAKYKYGFNGMEKDNETTVDGGDYDFGARIYDSRLGRWLALDPLMTHYPDFSAFSALGNNPLIFLDPDGKVLMIIGDNGIYTYKNGKLFINKDTEADITNDKYATAVLTQIAELIKTPTGAKEVEYLMVDDDVTFINMLDSKNTMNSCVHPAEGAHGSAFIYFDPYTDFSVNTTNGYEAAPPYIALGHEMAHAISYLDGTCDESEWFPDATNDEKYASYVENKIRKEASLNARVYYGDYNEDQTGIPESKLIDTQGKNLYKFKYAGIPDNDIKKIEVPKLNLLPLKKTTSGSGTLNLDSIGPINMPKR